MRKTLELIISLLIVFFLTTKITSSDIEKAPEFPEIKTETPEDIIIRVAVDSGVSPTYMLKLAQCESSMNPKAFNKNRNGTYDLGIFQINSVHKELSDEDKYDVYESAYWTALQIQLGKQNMWVCNGKIHY